MTYRIWAGLVVIAGMLVAVTMSLAAAPEDKLPASASLVLLLDKPSEAAVKWQQTALGSMLAGKEFVPFYAELQKGEIAAPLNPKPALGLDWADIARFKEPAALAVLEGEAKQPALIFLAGGKEDAGEVKRVMAEAEKYFEVRKAKRAAKKIAECEVVTYEVAAATGKEASVCIHITQGDLFAATSSAAASDKLVKQWEEGENSKSSLSQDADFKKVDAQSRKLASERGVDVRWFVRPLALAELLQKKVDPKVPGARVRDRIAIARKQGVNAVTSMGGVVTLQPDKSHDFEVASLIVARRPFEKGMRLADMKPGKAIEPPAWVEDDVGSYISWNWDFAAALEGAGAWVDEKLSDDGFFAAYLGNLRLDKQVDVKKDIVGRLGPGIFEVGDSHRAKDASNPTGARLILGIQSKEQQKLAKALSLVAREDDAVKNETVAGNPLRFAPEGEPLFTDPDPAAPKSTKSIQAYAVTPTLALLSTDTTWLRSKLAAKEKVKPLLDDPAYKQLALWSAKQENERTCLRGFMRSDQSGRLDYDAVRGATITSKSSLRAQALRFVLLGNSTAKAPAAALPKFDVLAPNLLPSGVSMAVSADGFELRAAVLRKE
ncbi:MAG: hypothetical protein IAF94_12765 [Pirellulaceae bacterium]|nr:hypothetical protein [Pirellulaceae bacterium]